jgi:hypothetical protein
VRDKPLALERGWRPLPGGERDIVPDRKRERMKLARGICGVARCVNADLAEITAETRLEHRAQRTVARIPGPQLRNEALCVTDHACAVVKRFVGTALDELFGFVFVFSRGGTKHT